MEVGLIPLLKSRTYRIYDKTKPACDAGFVDVKTYFDNLL